MDAPTPEAAPGREAASSDPLLYRKPEIYDVAFGWNLGLEIDFLEACWRKHAPMPVRTVLEPACGTGRVLAALADRGYGVTGYDVSAPMIAYAAARLRPWGGTVLRGDMATFRPSGRYDAAVNLVNSIGYLLEDDRVLGHWQRVAEALVPGGLYIVQLSYGGEPPEQSSFGPWTNRRGEWSTSLTWRVAREDPARRRSYQECRIEASRGAEREIIEESHVLRYWTQEDFDRLIERSPLELMAVYYDRFEEHPLEEPRTGELGNLYHVLRRADSSKGLGATPFGDGPRRPRPDRWAG